MDRKILKAVVITGLLVLAVSAYAANNLTLNHAAMVNGKQLTAGEYQVKIGANGEVTFLRGKTEVATAKATMKDLDKKAPFDAVITKAMDGGDVPSITEIQFQGKKQSLVFDNTRASNER
jgi:ribosomal protein S4